MEQWNSQEELVVDKICENLGWGEMGQLYSMNECLLMYYRDDLLEKHNMKEADLKETTLRKQVQEIIESNEGETGKDVDVVIKNLKNKLFLIVDSLLGEGNHKLLANEKREYKFTIMNVRFIGFLFATFQLEDSKRIRKKMILEADEEYLKSIYFGLKEFAKNENTLLKEEDVEQLWSIDYCMAYRKMMKACQSLDNMVDYYSNIPRDFVSNIEFFNRAEKLLSSCEEFLCRMGDSMVQFPPEDIFNDIISGKDA